MKTIGMQRDSNYNIEQKEGRTYVISTRQAYTLISHNYSKNNKSFKGLCRGVPRSLRQGGAQHLFWLNLARKFHFFDFSTKTKQNFPKQGGVTPHAPPPFSGRPLIITPKEIKEYLYPDVYTHTE
jgi:hypothetical protein